MERRAWIGDDVLDRQDDLEQPQERGSSWSEGSADVAPKVRNPIGFMRFKPVVRVKAWTQPIAKGGT
jgi:hypothetical protein